MLAVRFLLSLVLIFSVACEAAPAVSAQATDPAASQPPPKIKSADITYFPETGHFLAYGFRAYWQKNGGLFQFGYPLTEEFKERNPADGKVYTVQYFERARFEYHPEFAGTPFEVELGLLGVQTTTGRTFPQIQPFASTPDRYYFPEVRHSLGGAFKKYWDTRGGLAIYGYPISEEINEGGATVQYFERARFEYHPENLGTPYYVLLGLLGKATLEANGRTLPETYVVNLNPGNVVQGRTLQVTATAPSLGSISSKLDNLKLNFVAAGDKYLAVAPVAPDAAIKPQPLVTEIVDNTGVVRRFEQTVGVVAGQFEQQTVALDPTVEAGLGSEQEQQRERERVFSFYNQVTPDKLWTGKFNWPVNGPITTQFGSRRNYVGGGYEIHAGIDLGVAQGTPIYAPQRGKVVLAESQKVRGNIVILDHGLGLHTAYFHQSRILVKVGDMVNQGDVIGLVGTTGLSTGPHLHWEMRIGAVAVDPSEWTKREFS